MKLIKIATILLPLVLSFLNVFPQNYSNRQKRADSIKRAFLTEAALKNPLLRQVIVSTDVIPSSTLHSYLNGNHLFDGKINQQRTAILFNVPVQSWGKNSLSATFSAFQQHFHLSDITSYQTGLPDLEDKSIDKFSVGLTVTFNRTDSLLGHPVIYTGSISAVTNSSSTIQKMSYLGGMVMNLKRTPSMRFGLGLLINIDPSIWIPVIPVINYTKKYHDGYDLNINLPQQIMLRKTLSPAVAATFGTVLSGSVAFFKYSQPGIPQDVNYSTIDLKTGPGLEFRFAKKFIFGVNGGLWTPIQTRAFDREKNAREYFLKNEINAKPYINFSLSVLPFFH